MIKMITILMMGSMTLFAQTEEFNEYLIDLEQDFDIEHVRADSANLSSAVLLDAREKDEFEVSTIKDAIWVGYDDFELSQVDTLNRDQEIIVYCSVGYRSSKIGIRLKEAGFNNVKNLNGGIFLWVNEGRPIYNDSTITDKIHSYNRKWGRFITNSEIEKIY
jgi:rhodanese-related sulfurtransferase